jgi:serine/threonine protein kinase
MTAGVTAAIVIPVVLLIGVLLTFSINWRMRRAWKRRSIDFVSKMKRMQNDSGLSGLVGHVNDSPREIKRNAVRRTNKIGIGQFGEVWKGLLDETVSQDAHAYMVAIKTTHTADGEAAEELQREAIVMAVVGRHPNLVSLVGVVTTGPPLLLVISLCEHGSLHSQLKNRAQNSGVLVGYDGTLNPKSNIEIAREVASGMAMLESKGFVHRDLAARNVLIDSALVCKVADFGLSRKTKLNGSGDTVYASSRGIFPLRWTPPEAMRNLAFSTATDVWSFGVLVMELYEDARQPYFGVTNEALQGLLTSGWRAPQPTNCPHKVFNCVLECWAGNPSARPTFETLKSFYDHGNHMAVTQLTPTQSQSQRQLRQQIQSLDRNGITLAVQQMSPWPVRLQSEFEELRRASISDTREETPQQLPNQLQSVLVYRQGCAKTHPTEQRICQACAPITMQGCLNNPLLGGLGQAMHVETDAKLDEAQSEACECACADKSKITKVTYMQDSVSCPFEQPMYAQDGKHLTQSSRLESAALPMDEEFANRFAEKRNLTVLPTTKSKCNTHYL